MPALLNNHTAGEDRAESHAFRDGPGTLSPVGGEGRLGRDRRALEERWVVRPAGVRDADQPVGPGRVLVPTRPGAQQEPLEACPGHPPERLPRLADAADVRIPGENATEYPPDPAKPGDVLVG